MRRGVGLLLTAAFVSPAHAAEPNANGRVCRDEVPYCALDASGVLPDGYAAEALSAAQATWMGAMPCGGPVAVPHAGECPSEGGDGITTLVFGDPQDTLDGAVLCVTVKSPFGAAMCGDLPEIADADVICNDGVPWLTEHQECEGGIPLLPVLAHAMGHAWGVGHPCEGGEPCDDDADSSVMRWYGLEECEPVLLGRWDASTLAWLYASDRLPSIRCDRVAEDGRSFGVVPFELRCEADAVGDVSWSWGDGARSTGASASHVYATEGEHRVRATLSYEDECAGGPHELSFTHDVLACGVPEPAFRAERGPDGVLTLLNDTPIRAYGCITHVQWDLFDASGALVASSTAWEPTIAVPSPDRLRVVLNVGGPAGTAAAELWIAPESSGCQTSATSRWALLALLALRRRRATSGVPTC